MSKWNSTKLLKSYNQLFFKKGPNSSNGSLVKADFSSSECRCFEENSLLKNKVGNARMLGDSQRGLPGQKTRVSSLFTPSGVIAAHLEAVGRSHAAAEKPDKVVRRYL